MQIVQLTFFNIYPVTIHNIIYSLDRETKSKPTNRK